MKKELIVIVITLTLSSSLFAQQDPLYNLYYYNQQMLNPAYVGAYKSLTLNVASRKQWAGIAGAPLTNVVSLSSSLGERVGMGTMIVSDQLGINVTTELQTAFSYKVVNGRRGALSMGLQGGLIDYRYDYSKINIKSLNDDDLE